MSARRFRQDSPGDWKEELWERKFAELVEFQEKHGHTCVPVRWRRNVSLGRWVAHQRELDRLGELRPDRKARLLKLGRGWIDCDGRAKAHQPYLERMLARLAAFREKHGHDRVTKVLDYRLTRWLERQRWYLKKGQIKPERREQMDAAHFPWSPPGKSEPRSVEESLRRLAKYQERFGHTLVPARWKEDGALGRWVAHQRELHRAGRMPAERRRRLDAIGFQWSCSEAFRQGAKASFARLLKDRKADTTAG